MLTPESIRASVCITYAGRSGSFLVSQLLDHHPEILAVPPHAGTHLMAGLLNAIAGSRNMSAPDEFAQAICNHNPYLFRETDHTPMLGPAAAQMRVGVERALFQRLLAHQLLDLAKRGAGTFQNIFNAVHVAYVVAQGRKLATDRPLLAWQKHFADRGEREFIAKNFRDMQFLVAMRNPDITLSAHVDAYLFEHPPGTGSIEDLGGRLLDQFLFGCTVGPGDDRVLAVRFEDVHARTEQVMRALARHFAIRWDPILLRTTVDGETAYFNKHGKLITGTNPSLAKPTKAKSFHRLDRLRMRYVLWQGYRIWGYPAGPRWLMAVFRPQWLRGLLFSIPSKMVLRVYWDILKSLYVSFLKENAKVNAMMLEQAESAVRRPVPLLPLDQPALSSDATSQPDEGAAANPQQHVSATSQLAADASR